jgi:hypothetical protein
VMVCRRERGAPRSLQRSERAKASAVRSRNQFPAPGFCTGPLTGI